MYTKNRKKKEKEKLKTQDVLKDLQIENGKLVKDSAISTNTLQSQDIHITPPPGYPPVLQTSPPSPRSKAAAIVESIKEQHSPKCILSEK